MKTKLLIVSAVLAAVLGLSYVNFRPTTTPEQDRLAQVCVEMIVQWRQQDAADHREHERAMRSNDSSLVAMAVRRSNERLHTINERIAEFRKDPSTWSDEAKCEAYRIVLEQKAEKKG